MSPAKPLGIQRVLVWLLGPIVDSSVSWLRARRVGIEAHLPQDPRKRKAADGGAARPKAKILKPLVERDFGLTQTFVIACH